MKALYIKMKTIYKNLKIKDKLFFIISLIMFFICVGGLVSFHYGASLYEKRIYEEAAEVLNLASGVVDNELEKIEKLSFQIAIDDRIQDSLSYINSHGEAYQLYKTKAELQELLIELSQQERYISSIQLVDALGGKYTAGFNTKLIENREDVLDKAYEAGGTNVWLSGDEGDNLLISARQIRGKHNLNLDHYGFLIIRIDMDRLVRQFLDLSSNNTFVIMKNEDRIFSTEDALEHLPSPLTLDDRQGYKIGKIKDAEYLTAYLTSRYEELTYVNILPYETIAEQTNLIKRMMILFFIITFILAVVVSRKAANSIIQPLANLTKKMKQVQRGDFHIPDNLEEETYYDETGQLHRNFKIMLRKINELIRENYEKQLIIKETEYKALQAQINPHFLYNTLDSVNWMAKINKQDKISQLVEALGNMLRKIISHKDPLITIDEELEIVNNYVTIQKNRYEDRLYFVLNTVPGLGNFCIPKLSLQPMVENAIQHGLENMVDDCRIEITFLPGDEYLEIIVSDNGLGIAPETIDAIYKGEVKSTGSGIGLKNIHDRIRLMFGEDYGISIESSLGEGTKVTTKIPYSAR